MISQLTDVFLPRRYRLPLAFIKKRWRCKKNGENECMLMMVRFFCSPFFSIKLLFSWPTRDRNNAANRPNFALLPSPPARLHCNRAGTAKKGEKHWISAILQLSCSPFSQLNSCFHGKCASHLISSHRPNFALLPPPPARLHCNQAGTAQNGEKQSIFAILQLSCSPLFSIKLYLSGRTPRDDISSHRQNFAL